MDPYRTFLDNLRYALNHLYEPEVLRHSPLQELLKTSDRPQTSLGEFLTEAIEALKPPPTEAADSPAWHVYELLHYRYVQRASQRDLARQFACSVRQVRRKQAHALTVLGDALARQAGYAGGVRPIWPERETGPAATAGDDPLQDEYAVTLADGQGQGAEVYTELLAIADLLQPLLARYDIALHLPSTDDAWLTSMPRVFVRQALISLFTGLAPFAAGGAIHLAIIPADEQVCVQIQFSRSTGGHLSVDDHQGADEARFLLEMNGGGLSILSQGHDLLEAIVILPAAGQLPVLAVDDNRDILQLFARYTQGTQFTLIPCSDPTSVMQLACERNPRVITLDIMMEGIDGWQLMRDLREHPATATTPIIVCSVLAQNELAKMLGADDFVSKPVSRETYLAALEHQVSRRESPSASAPQWHPVAPYSKSRLSGRG